MPARASRDAAVARLQGAQAGWHDARIAVAAEAAADDVLLTLDGRDFGPLEAPDDPSLPVASPALPLAACRPPAPLSSP